MSHSHAHHKPSGENGLKVAFFLNLAFTILELFGGLFVNSVAIISDAIHDLGDSLALGTAWYLERTSKKKANFKYTYGFARFSLLGALINGVILIAGSIFVVIEAIERIQSPETPNAEGMVLFAIVGIAVNGFAAWRLSNAGSHNAKVVSWHLIEDVLGWAAVLIVAIVLMFFDYPVLDPALSLIITLYILWNVVKRLRLTLRLFLQGAPGEIDVRQIIRQINELKLVHSLHHTHIWSLEGEKHVFTTHVKLRDIDRFEQLHQTKKEIKAILDPYSFEHCTIETELDKESCSMGDM